MTDAGEERLPTLQLVHGSSVNGTCDARFGGSPEEPAEPLTTKRPRRGPLPRYKTLVDMNMCKQIVQPAIGREWPRSPARR